ncbi:TPA: hypothetical protein N0F65_002926 [Lagenidium giganteum]|uniref:Uncharacterized protein n=1 Tax=Lagenidium giganteum TaxID=4803 RepID=A0AAV2Z7R4_9STRA|nr:TPA: hypothetical protein N0F65_002926 [Lagenidium giganteum]
MTVGDGRVQSLTNYARSQVFHISLLYNLCLHNRRRRPWWSRIEPHLLLGALPFRDKQHLERLTKDENVRAVVTMNQPTELLPNMFGSPVAPEDWASANVAQCFGTTNDFSPPSVDTIRRCVAFIHEHLERGETTYVHCKAGRGRSTVVVVAYLMQYRNMAIDDAYATVRRHRPHVSLHPKQYRILTAFQNTLERAN